ncbi:ShlB/FhaC/HecB family hemolysin secretion/activation protein, partial [Niveibacterium sp.]|uniref:ShlB/FhaC/HecB family hemolysin secretion/activation protein n=1 Tax=Niveibacterium sp. TaxID=2017444 RepID=UPI0035B10201
MSPVPRSPSAHALPCCNRAAVSERGSRLHHQPETSPAANSRLLSTPTRDRAYALLMALTLAVAGAAHAQVAPTRPVVPRIEELKRDVEQATPQRDDEVKPPAIPSAPARELGKPADDLRMDVRGYRVTGLSEADPAELERVLQKFAGVARSYEDISNAAAAATEYLQSELGYYLGYAYLPEQSPKDGVIEIAVMEGRLDQITLDWNPKSLIRQSVIESHLSAIPPGAIIKVRDVERLVFVLNDLLGGSARFEVKAGRVPGTATLVVIPEPDSRYTAQVTGDNLGSRYSGEYRLGVGASVMSPLGLGDGLSLNGMASQTGGLGFGLLNYTVPISRYGFKFGVSLSHMRYRLNEDDFPLGLTGTTDAYSLFALYPVVRGRNLNVFAQLGWDRKDFVDSQTALDIDSRKQTRMAWTGLTG